MRRIQPEHGGINFCRNPHCETYVTQVVRTTGRATQTGNSPCSSAIPAASIRCFLKSNQGIVEVFVRHHRRQLHGFSISRPYISVDPQDNVANWPSAKTTAKSSPQPSGLPTAPSDRYWAAPELRSGRGGGYLRQAPGTNGIRCITRVPALTRDDGNIFKTG